MQYNETSIQKDRYEPLLQVKQLEVNFDGFKAICGLDFSLQSGELRFLIGPTGAGKTTLLDVLCGKVRPTKGTILFKNRTVLTYHPEQQVPPPGIGRKLQAPTMICRLTVQENLLLSMRQKRGLLSTLIAKSTKEQRERLTYYLDMIGLSGKAKELAGTLSRSEKLWLEIGMLLIHEPDILLLDEPAAGIDGDEAEKTGELLHRICSRQTVVVAEHNIEFVRQFAQTITVMHQGTVLREGTMQELQNDGQVMEIYLGRQDKRQIG